MSAKQNKQKTFLCIPVVITFKSLLSISVSDSTKPSVLVKIIINNEFCMLYILFYVIVIKQ